MAIKIKRIIEDIDIDASIKYHLAQQKYWDVNDVLAIICTIIYPFRYEYKIFSSPKIDAAKLTLCKYSAKLASLSFEGVKEYFKHEIIPSMKFVDKGCILNVLDEKKFKYDREKGVVIVGLKDNIIQTILTSYKNKAYLYDGFGVESYCKNDKAEQISNTINDTAQIPVEETLQEGTESLEDDSTPEIYEEDTQNSEVNDNVSRDTVEQTQFPPEIKTANKKKNSSRSKDLPDEDIKPYIELYKTIVGSRGDVSRFTYIWQWRISPTEYKDIKALLTKLPKAKIEQLLNSEHFVFLIVVYIAEFFKREWDAHAKKGALTDIGLSNIAKSIVQKYYKNCENIVYKHENSNTQEWLDALYCEGGLPIKYIVNSRDRIQGNRGEFVRLCDNLYSHPEESIEGFANKLSVKSIQYSYENDGSIYHYIESLKDSENGICRVLCDADLEQEPFVTFCKLLKEGLDRNQNKCKFRIKYRIWKTGTKFLVKRLLKMNECNIEGYNESPADVISRKRVESWLKTSDLPSLFALRLKTGQWSSLHKFVPYGSESYRSDIWEDTFELPNLTAENISLPIEVYLENRMQDIDKRVYQEDFPKVGYIVFRQDNLFEWVDKASTRGTFSKSAVLYDTNLWQVSEQEVYSPISGYAWVEYAESVTLESLLGKKTVTLYNTKERLWIKPSEDSIHPIAKKPFVKFAPDADKKVKVSGNGIDRMAVLLKHPVKFDVVKSEDGTLVSTNLQIEKRCPGESEYTPYEPNDTTLEGYVTFKIFNKTISGIKREVGKIEGYLLNSDATISRYLGNERRNNGYIKFHHPQRGDQDCNDVWSNDKCDEEVVTMNIKDGNYTFVLNVVRPFKRRDRFRGKQLDTENRAIPIRFLKQYQVRVMDDNGVHRIDVDADHRPVIMSKLLDRLLTNPTSNGEIKQGDLTYVVYTDEIQHKTNGAVEKRGYYVDSGNDINDEGLKFKFLSLTDVSLIDIPLRKVTYSIGTRTMNYLMLDLPNCGEGVVLQSLDKDNYPLRYYRPKFISATQENVDDKTKRLRRTKRLCRYVAEYKCLNSLPEEIFKHFDVACETGCYYSSLDRLLALVYNPPCLTGAKCPVNLGKNLCETYLPLLVSRLYSDNRVAIFYDGFSEYCKKYCINKINYEHLDDYRKSRRKSAEQCCDWLAIPDDNNWKKIVDNKEHSLLGGQSCSDEERMARFYIGYCDYCQKHNKEVNYTELWRMSEELCCDWLTIRRSVWKSVLGDDEQKKSLVMTLLIKRPKEFYKKLLDNYWSLHWPNKQGRVPRDAPEARAFLKYILNGEGKRPSGYPSRDAVNSEIERLINNQNIQLWQ